ncbi:hypothetical protein BAU17_13335 [Enterococcus sp. CU12B]|uniref:Polysaccharide biosynthesis protein C-terminal domain-containing protein n=2 Tax=Candidatus Enterococcus willemsii TaxID=1857215 RepID=A0ABQ6Z1K0_9ENTE|nr:hypothetical protein BAU17_13335 [Enterococcus sp. CU12B]
MWIYIRKKIIFIKVTLSDTLKHFMPALSFFIPKIAIVLYTNLNKTLLGWLDSAESVGYYANTMTINSILVTLITTMDLVLLPKLSNLVAHGNAKNVLKVIKQTLGLQLYFTIPIMFGVWSITPKFVSWFFGDKFLFIEKTIPIVAPLIIVIPIGMAVGRQYLVPYNKMKVYNFAVIMGAFISIVTNVVLIPIYGIYGALIATIASEFFVTLTRFRAFKKETQFEIDYRGIILNVLSGAIMFVMIRMLTNNLGSSLVTTIIQVTLGIGVYLCLTTILQTNPLIGLIKKYIN